MDASYFEKLYQACLRIYADKTGTTPAQEKTITRFDSTIVFLSARLLTTGYHLKGGDTDHVRQLKFTIGLGDLPQTAHLVTEQTYTSENAALRAQQQGSYILRIEAPSIRDAAPEHRAYNGSQTK